MKVVGLISGGKDSCYNMMQCISEGHDIVALANLRPKDKDELDSYMYQTVGHQAIDLYAEAMGVPLYRRTIEGGSIELEKDYIPNKQDEVEDLYELLKQIKEEESIEGVSVGAVLSDYQRVRVESVCQRLGLTSLAYLWRRDQGELLHEMIACQVHAILIKVAAMGLSPSAHLGKTLEEIQPHMIAMNMKFGLNICGEGGEYESFTLDCPLFNKRLVVDESDIVIHSNDAFAPVAYLNFKKVHLEDKNCDSNQPLYNRIKDLPMKRNASLFYELFSHGAHQLPPTRAVQSICSSNLDTLINFTHSAEAFVPNVLIQKRKDELWVSGICAQVLNGDSIADVTTKAMEKLSETISHNEFELSDLVVMHLYVRNMAEFSEINSVYKKLFDINPPARICVQVDFPGNVALQLDCYAKKKCNTSNRKTMHVQGLSHWAPANIGPYSQAVQVDDTIYVAGQIPLCPASMKIVMGGIIPQTRLSVRHVERILEAMVSGTELKNVVLAICFVTDVAYIPHARHEWASAVGHATTETQFSDEVPASGILECVIVPTLPRGALIEWQTQAFTPSKHCERSSSEVNNEFYKINNEICTAGKGKEFDIAFKTTLEFVQSEDYLDRLEEMIMQTLNQVDRLIDFPKIFTFIPSFTIFYNQKLVQVTRLVKAVNSYLETEGIDVPSITYVPVLGFSSPSQLLSICH